jgi:hypothetical protein
MTRSQVNIVKGSNLIQTNSKVVKNRIKSNYATLNQPDQPKKRGRLTHSKTNCSLKL